ncbi:MAG TPA: tetratricopeptide repeat protein, partial [Thermomicrobiales bacterium]|nr:tetratricopeptide repeat protein [Thermomicrobiales bacterium]
PGLQVDFPPLSRPVQRPTNLPAETTTFIGREEEIQTIRERLLDPTVRLVTLVGPGGVGKTHLALRVARDVLPEFEDGVFFVRLAPIHDPALIIPTVAQTLGLHDTGDDAAFGAVFEHLKNKHLLLLLDNFDHLIDASPQLAQLLSICPQLKILVTSREAPRLRGNQVIAVTPLDVPDLERLPSMDELAGFESVHLFVERARETDPDFDLTEENAASVAAIAHRLDGLPLAIELAAARIRLFSPQALLARLDRRLQLLTSGPKDLPARQQTLRGTVAWSYDLLEPAEQALFRRLAVFQGGFTLTAAEAICCDPGDLDANDVVLGLDSLVSKSLVRRVSISGDLGEPRFGMLQTIREYGLEQLTLAIEAEETRRRHASYYVALAERAEPQLLGSEQATWLWILDRDHDNLRAALSWAYEAHNVDLGLRLAGALWPFWDVHGYFFEGRGWLDRLLEWDGPPGLRAKVLTGAGTFAWSQGNYDRATTLHGEALDLYREIEDRVGIAFALNNLGVQAIAQEDYDRASALLDESLTVYREQGNEHGIADVLNNRGLAAQYQGDLTRAEALYGESLELRRKLGDDQRVADAVYNLGEIAYYQHDYGRAWDLYYESLVLRRELGSRWGAALCFAALAGVAAALEEYERAARLAGVARALLEATGYSLDSTEAARFAQTSHAIRANLGDAACNRLLAEGRLMSIDEAIDYGLGAPEG